MLLREFQPVSNKEQDFHLDIYKTIPNHHLSANKIEFEWIKIWIGIRSKRQDENHTWGKPKSLAIFNAKFTKYEFWKEK